MTQVRHIRCGRCGAHLARDNATGRCAACRTAERDRVAQPPHVPDDFWRNEALRQALAARHMGQVIRAYRCHPYHGRQPLPQEVVAGWVGITQAQLSRIEHGPAIMHLDRLIHWARVLRIPARYLWFKLPDTAEAPPTMVTEPGLGCEDGPMHRRSFVTTLPTAGAAGLPGMAEIESLRHHRIAVDGLAALHQVRCELDEALASSSVSPRQLELIEESVAEHVQVYPATAPTVMLSRLAGECTEVQRLSRQRQPAAVQARLSGQRPCWRLCVPTP